MIEVLRLEKIEKLGRIPLREFTCYFLKGEVVSFVLRSNTLKNTLMDIMSGVVMPDGGSVYLDEQPVNTIERNYILKQNVYCIRKVGGLIDNLTVTDNIFLNRKSALMERDIRPSIEVHALLYKYGVADVLPMMKAESLSYATRHIIECLKAVANGAKLILVDDLLNRYTPAEEMRFEKLIYQLVEEGVAFCFFTNTYGKIVAKSNRAVVVRDGTIAANFYGRDVKNKTNVIAALAGRLEGVDIQPVDTVDMKKHLSDEAAADAMIVFENMKLIGEEHAGIKISKGTICGIFDTSSDLETQLTNTLTGKGRFFRDVFVDGQPYCPNDSYDAAQQGVYLINTNADYSFAMLNMSLIDNVTLMMPASITKFGIETKRIKKFMASRILELLGCEQLLAQYPENKPIGYANRRTQMEIAIARLVCAKAKIIVLINPGSYYDDFNLPELRKMLLNACNIGTTFLILSSNIQQLIYLCNRVTTLELQDQQ